MPTKTNRQEGDDKANPVTVNGVASESSTKKLQKHPRLISADELPPVPEEARKPPCTNTCEAGLFD